VVVTLFGDDVGLALVLAQDTLEKLELLLSGRKDKAGHLLNTLEPSDDLEGISLEKRS
jgi:hypothetical protein